MKQPLNEERLRTDKPSSKVLHLPTKKVSQSSKPPKSSRRTQASTTNLANVDKSSKASVTYSQLYHQKKEYELSKSKSPARGSSKKLKAKSYRQSTDGLNPRKISTHLSQQEFMKTVGPELKHFIGDKENVQNLANRQLSTISIGNASLTDRSSVQIIPTVTLLSSKPETPEEMQNSISEKYKDMPMKFEQRIIQIKDRQNQRIHSGQVTEMMERDPISYGHIESSVNPSENGELRGSISINHLAKPSISSIYSVVSGANTRNGGNEKAPDRVNEQRPSQRESREAWRVDVISDSADASVDRIPKLPASEVSYMVDCKSR